MSAFFIIACSSWPFSGMHANADARGHAALLAEDHDGLHHCRQTCCAPPWPTCVGIVDLLNEHDELVAAEARDDVARAQALPQARGHLAQQHVARVVAECIVDDLEAIEIDEQHGDLAVVASRGLDREMCSNCAEHRAIRQPGEAVVRSEVLDALLRVLARGDVLDHRDVVQHLARCGRASLAIVSPTHIGEPSLRR